MSDILTHIYNACDPFQPANAQQYLDCAESRGSGSLAERFQSHLSFAQDHCCFLFTGHIGCGKSSELEHLKHVLAMPHPIPPYARYFPIRLDVNDYLDPYDVTVTDILLAIVTEIATVLREELKIELNDSYFTRRLNEVKEFFLSEVEINEGELELPSAKVKITRLKRDPQARHQVRAALSPRLATILDEINFVFERARLLVRQAKVGKGEQPYKDFVLMLDNLEKIQRFEDMPEGIESHRELFVERAAQLTGLKAHIIYTLPLRLARWEGPRLEQNYGMAPFVLPMVKIIERNRHPFPPGIAQLHTLLKKRLTPYSLDQAFAADALDFLLTYSGGHIRYLMSFIQEACTYTNDVLPIPLTAAHRAIQQTVRTYSAAIPESHWVKLATLDLSSDQRIVNDDLDYLAMLENLSVLEYINGDGGDDPFFKPEQWYAVNPIVRQLGKFKTVRQQVESEKAGEG